MTRSALYLLLTGITLGFAIYAWHVWSDNAYLLIYLVALLLLAAGATVATIAAARRSGALRAVAALVLAGVAAFVLVGPLGLTQPVGEAILAGGNGSQSPCIAEFRRENADEIARHEEEMRQRAEAQGIRPPTANEIRTSEMSGAIGAMAQFLVPFLAGLAPLLMALRGASPRSFVPALVAAAAVVAYVYARGPGAWCGQIFGLDAVVLIVAGIVVSARLRSR